jgi:hypothetical protein
MEGKRKREREMEAEREREVPPYPHPLYPTKVRTIVGYRGERNKNTILVNFQERFRSKYLVTTTDVIVSTY